MATQLGGKENLILLGILELLIVAVFLFKRTSILGAIFMTYYMAGAITVQFVANQSVVVLLEILIMAMIVLRFPQVAAMTRSRADQDGIVGDMVVKYYTQRASTGMILTEGINISEAAFGSPLTPGLFSPEQVNAWKKVTQSVHDAGGLIYAQLWHTGRIGHSVDRDGALPVAPSAVAIKSMQHFTSQGMKEFEVPHELTVKEIKETIDDYSKAALNAIEAGFDGVELHAANRYLPHQFLSDSANLRTDSYGGRIENKSRFILEIIKALVETVGGDKVGFKISPFHPYGDILFDDQVASFSYLLEELNKFDQAFVELMKRSPMFPLPEGYPTGDEIEIFGTLSKNTLIANTGYTKDSGEKELNKGIAKLISFGSLFLANPDLPKRFHLDAELNVPDRNTMFGGGEHGYIDNPFL